MRLIFGENSIASHNRCHYPRNCESLQSIVVTFSLLRQFRLTYNLSENLQNLSTHESCFVSLITNCKYSLALFHRWILQLKDNTSQIERVFVIDDISKEASGKATWRLAFIDVNGNHQVDCFSQLTFSVACVIFKTQNDKVNSYIYICTCSLHR